MLGPRGVGQGRAEQAICHEIRSQCAARNAPKPETGPPVGDANRMVFAIRSDFSNDLCANGQDARNPNQGTGFCQSLTGSIEGRRGRTTLFICGTLPARISLVRPRPATNRRTTHAPCEPPESFCVAETESRHNLVGRFNSTNQTIKFTPRRTSMSLNPLRKHPALSWRCCWSWRSVPATVCSAAGRSAKSRSKKPIPRPCGTPHLLSQAFNDAAEIAHAQRGHGAQQDQEYADCPQSQALPGGIPTARTPSKARRSRLLRWRRRGSNMPQCPGRARHGLRRDHRSLGHRADQQSRG